MSLKVYRDSDANAAVIETTADGTLGMFFNNELKAVGNGDGTLSIMDEPKSTATVDFFEVANVTYSDFTDSYGNSLGADEAAVCNSLNAIFSHTGSSTGAAPVITSSLSQSISDGDQVNYFAEATGGVSYEWSNIPAGMSVNSANERNLIGSPTGGPGTYNITLKAINYFGTDTETVVLTVTSSYANTKSIDFENQDYLGANASLLDAILGRASNGAGSSDAWTIHLWFKGSTNSTGQTIFYFGDNDTTNGGHINLRFIGGTDTLRLQYGTTNNYIRWQSTNTALPAGSWKHIMITYDGGTTGSSQADLNDYYSRFTVFIDGVDVTSSGSWSHNNYGYTGGIDPDNLRVGRYASGNYMRDGCRVDELAIWAGDESANIADIYNSGTPHDLDLLASSPDHWWRMGDGDTYPTIQDNVGTAHFVMYNMTVADIVNDTP